MHEPKVAGLLFLTFHIIKADRFTKTGSGQIQQDNSKQNVVPIRPIWTRSLPLQLAYSGAVRKRLSPAHAGRHVSYVCKNDRFDKTGSGKRDQKRRSKGRVSAVFSLCLSRACLGKMFAFIYKWLENAVFRRLLLQPVLDGPMGWAGGKHPLFFSVSLGLH